MKTDATPLIWAAVLNNAEVAQALLEAKADPAARTEKKLIGPGNAFEIAVKHDREVAERAHVVLVCCGTINMKPRT